MIYTNVEVHHESRQISKTEITAKIVKDVFIEGIGGGGGCLSKNGSHHGWSTTKNAKNFKITLGKML